MMALEAGAIIEFNRRAELDGWPIRAESRLAFEASELIEALSAWRMARNGSPIPTRAKLSPRGMKHFLKNVALVDILREPSRIRFRATLTGSELDQTYGIRRGSIFDEVLTEPSRTRWQETLELPLLTMAPVRTWGRVGYRDMTYLHAETLLAPMGANAAVPDSLLVVVHLSQFRGLSGLFDQVCSLSA